MQKHVALEMSVVIKAKKKLKTTFSQLFINSNNLLIKKLYQIIFFLLFFIINSNKIYTALNPKKILETSKHRAFCCRGWKFII